MIKIHVSWPVPYCPIIPDPMLLIPDGSTSEGRMNLVGCRWNNEYYGANKSPGAKHLVGLAEPTGTEQTVPIPMHCHPVDEAAGIGVRKDLGKVIKSDQNGQNSLWPNTSSPS